jgi:hypothetical protein
MKTESSLAKTTNPSTAAEVATPACAMWLLPLLLLLTLPAAGQSQNLTYTTTNGRITITGYTGSVASVTNVTIPDTINGHPVTSIGDYAFWHCGSLTNVTIGTNVTSIGGYAFGICSSLTSVTIPNSVTSLGDEVFYDCTSLASVTIGNSVTNIGYQAFAVCYGLTNVTIPNSVTSIGTEAFYDCTSLASVTIGNSVTAIGDDAFDGCTSLTSVTIPNSVTSIGDYAFRYCSSLTGVTIGNGVTSIGDHAFANCFSLTSVTIPNSVTSIGDYAFYYCISLTNVTIGTGVTSIGGTTFWGCISLASVYFWGNAPSADATLFSGDNNPTIYYLPGTTGWSDFSAITGLTTALWFLPNPLILNNGPSFGVQANRFGFIIFWATNTSVVVEACTNPASHTWTPVGTNTLTGGSSYFSDPKWMNYPVRFYRLRSP